MDIAKKYPSGNIVEISAGGDTFAFGRIISFPYVEFYDLILTRSESDTFDFSELHSKDPIFTVLVHKSCLSKVVGYNAKNIPQVPPVFSQNAFDLSDIEIRVGSTSLVKATFEEVQNMEQEAVWESNHVADRIRDYLNRVPNQTVVFLKPKNPAEHHND